MMDGCMSEVKVPFCKPDIKPSERDCVLDVLKSQWLTGGQRTLDFESRFAEYVGAKHAIALNSCTSALHLAMRALDIKSGDEVIVPTLTFAATANAPIFCGARPVLADIDERTFNISVQSIIEKITKNTKAVIPVHFGGQPCEMEDILRVARLYNLSVVEDCAHSLGATYKESHTGTMSKAGCFSFYPTKPITVGEGGMLVTNDSSFAENVKRMRSHCMTREAWGRSKMRTWQYDVIGLGYNYRLDEISSALGISQLSRLNEMNAKRATISAFYTRRLSEVRGIIPHYQASDRTSSHHLYVIRVIEKDYGMSRDGLYQRLAERGVECSVHYTPLHLMSYYGAEFGSKKGDCPVAEKVYTEILSLPIFPSMLPWQMEYVVKQIEELAK